MPLNFPDSPIIGQIYDTGSIVFEWDGVVWQAVGAINDPAGVLATGTPQNNQLAIWTLSDTLEGDANLVWDGAKLLVNQPAGTTRGSIRALGGFYDYGSSGNGGYGGFSAALTTGGAEFEAYGGDPASDAFIEFNARDTTSGNVQVRLFRNTNTTGASTFSILRGDGTSTASHSFSRANVTLLASDGGAVNINNPTGSTGTVRVKGGVYDYATSGNGGYAAFQASLSTGGASFRAYSGASTASTFADFDAPELTTGNYQVRFFRNTNTTGTTEVLYYLGDGSSTLAHAFRDTTANLSGQTGGKVAIGKLGTPAVALDIEGTDAVKMPVGTTAQRPTAVTGQLRYNSTYGDLEVYNGAWTPISAEGTARAHASINQQGTQAIYKSFGVSSITDTGVGTTTVNFTNTMSTNTETYLFNGNIFTGSTTHWILSSATTNVQGAAYRTDTFAYVDISFLTVSIFGDLA